MDDINTAIKALRTSANDSDQKELARLLLVRAGDELALAVDEANRLSKNAERDRRKRIRAFFRWRLLPSWLLTLKGVVILLLLAAVGAFLARSPLYGLAGSAIGIVLLLTILKQVTRGINNSMYESMKYTPAGYSWRKPCSMCISGAEYTLSVPGRGETLLCGTHSRKLSAMLALLACPPSVTAGLRAAQRDAEEALDLDPDLKEIQSVLEQIYGSINTFQGE